MPMNSRSERNAIQRAGHSVPALVQHVCVDHRRAHIAMAKLFLHRVDDVAPFSRCVAKEWECRSDDDTVELIYRRH